MRFTVRCAGVLVVLGVLSGCSVSAGPRLSGEKLSGAVASELEKEVGQRPDSVDCPDDLDGEVGSTTRCTLDAGSMTYGVTVTTTSVKDDNIAFDIEVDDEPTA